MPRSARGQRRVNGRDKFMSRITGRRGLCYSWVVSLVWPTKREHAMSCDMVAHLSINWLLWSIFFFVYRVVDGWCWWWLWNLWRKERKRMRTAKEATTIGCSLFIIRALSCNKLRYYRNVVAVPLLLLLLPMPRSLYGTYLWVMVYRVTD